MTSEILAGSACTPSPSMMCPRKLIIVLAKSHFSFSVRLALLKDCRTACRHWSCVFLSAACTKMSSMWQTTLCRPAKICDMVLWKSSLAEDRPKGSLLKANLLNGVMKQVSGLKRSLRGLCQKPLFASNFEKILLPASWERLTSTECMV